jgi:hypothetical protein
MSMSVGASPAGGGGVYGLLSSAIARATGAGNPSSVIQWDAIPKRVHELQFGPGYKFDDMHPISPGMGPSGKSERAVAQRNSTMGPLPKRTMEIDSLLPGDFSNRNEWWVSPVCRSEHGLAEFSKIADDKGLGVFARAEFISGVSTAETRRRVMASPQFKDVPYGTSVCFFVFVACVLPPSQKTKTVSASGPEYLLEAGY